MKKHLAKPATAEEILKALKIDPSKSKILKVLEKEIEKGDVVNLKPRKMTVSDTLYGKVYCVWFNKANQLKSGLFDPDEIEKEN